MKTMRAPKMDVVRFTESDVIVASGNANPDVVHLANLGNGKASDNRVYGTGFDFTFEGLNNGSHMFILANTSNFSNGSQSSSLQDLIDATKTDETDTTSYASYNGTYEYNYGSGVYVKQ